MRNYYCSLRVASPSAGFTTHENELGGSYVTTTESAVRSIVLPLAITTVSSASMWVPVPTGPAGSWTILLSYRLPASSACFAGSLTMSKTV